MQDIANKVNELNTARMAETFRTLCLLEHHRQQRPQPAQPEESKRLIQTTLHDYLQQPSTAQPSTAAPAVEQEVSPALSELGSQLATKVGGGSVCAG